MSGNKKRRVRPTAQIKVTIPKSHWPEIQAAMEYDGATRASQFALAAILQRVRRIKQMQDAENKPAP